MSNPLLLQTVPVIVNVITGGGAEIPTGSVSIYVGTPSQGTPEGWLYCDGTEYLKADYPALGALLNGDYNQFGTPSDSDHFCVPNMAQKFARGYDGTFPDSLATEGGYTKTPKLAEGGSLSDTGYTADLEIYTASPLSGVYGLVATEVDLSSHEVWAKASIAQTDVTESNIPPYIEFQFIIKT